MVALGHLAQDKFGLELSDIYFYSADSTTSVSLADTNNLDVLGATVIDPTNDQQGDIFIDAEGSKNNQVNTLGHEVIETQTLQEGDANDASQEALANAFGGQFEDRIDQATGDQLSSTSSTAFTASLQNSQAVQTGTEKADQVGNAEVDHNALGWFVRYGIPAAIATTATTTVVVTSSDPLLTNKVANEIGQLFNNSNENLQEDSDTSAAEVDINTFSHAELGAFLKEGEVLSGVADENGEGSGYLVRTEDGVVYSDSLSWDESWNTKIQDLEVNGQELTGRMVLSQLNEKSVNQALQPSQAYVLPDGSVIAVTRNGDPWLTYEGNPVLEAEGFVILDDDQILGQIPGYGSDSLPDNIRSTGGSPMVDSLPSSTEGSEIPYQLPTTTAGDQTHETMLDDITLTYPAQDEAGASVYLSEIFGNQLSSQLQSELDHAAELGAVPIKPGEEGFDGLVNSGTVIWTIDTNGVLVFGANTINHTVLTKGGSVLSAGEAEIVSDGSGGYMLLDINNKSGHYQPSEDTLKKALDIFRANGIK